MPHPDQNAYPGQVLNGRWEVGAHLADGYFSLVYEGVDRVSGADCAIKVLSLTRVTSQFLAEFQSEGALLEALAGCSNVVDLLARGQHSMTVRLGGADFPITVHYMVLERADGSLAEMLLNRHALDWLDRLLLLRGVVKGMHQMHLAQTVNRDLKSDNVLLFAERTETIAKVADLGRSRDTRQAPRFSLQEYEQGRGDLRYAPPEYLWGLGNASPDEMRLADLYLVGSVFFELATGQGLTAMALRNPLAIQAAAQALSPADRVADFTASTADLQARYELAYDVFRHELAGPMRQVGERLLRRLTAVDPLRREMSLSRRRPTTTWNLEWILRQVDIMRLTLATERRSVARGHGRGRP